MSDYTRNSRRRRHRKQRRGLIALIGILSVLLAVLLAVVLLDVGPQAALHGELTMEAGGQLPSAHSFLKEDTNTDISYLDTSKVWTNVPGVYDITLLCEEKERAAKIRVVDTVAPAGKTQDLTASGLKVPAAQDFVTEIRDVTDVTVAYVQEPNKNLDQQTVTIALTDTSGNITHLSATLNLIIDREAPVITGVKDKTIYQGDAIAYKTGVEVKDNMSENLEYVVDRSQIDTETPGEYTVIYKATDDFGNTSEVAMKVTVLEKREGYASLEQIEEAVNAVFAEILRDDMTQQQQVWAIYVWIRTNCHYINHSEKDDYRQAAYRMLTERQGDCFNYYGLTKVMLDQLGIPNIDVRKVKNYEGDNDHYWSLVSVDGGINYYHVDTTPRSNPASFCLVTDAYMDEYSANNGKCFNRDKSLYPATPEDPL
jgi:hypothetical protein